jgi:flagellin
MNADSNQTSGNVQFNASFTASVVDGEIVISSKSAADVADATYTLATTSNGTDATGSTKLQDGATFGLTAIDAALATIAEDRATLGAMQAQLESTVRNLSNVAENTAAAAGRIMDTDYAAETANLTKAQILQQAATSILAQANAQPQAVLSLLQ